MKSIFLRLLILYLVPIYLGPSLSIAQDRDPFRVGFKDDIVHVTPGEKFDFEVKFSIPPKHYLYDDKTTLEFKKSNGAKLANSFRPAAEEFFDPFVKKSLSVHFKSFTHKIVFSVPKNAKPGRYTLEGVLRYQGCSEKLCLRPVQKMILIPVEVQAVKATLSNEPQKAEIALSVNEKKKSEGFVEPIGNFWTEFVANLKDPDPEFLINQGKPFLLAFSLVGGILSAFLPCVLPMIPLTLNFIGVRPGRRDNLRRALLLILGLVFMYSGLLFLITSLNWTLGFQNQSPYFDLTSSIFFSVLALGMFGVIPFQLPPKLHNRIAQMGGSSPLGIFIAGLTLGLVASPCTGPILIAMGGIAKNITDPVYRFFLLFNYGVGMGLPFLLFATGVGGLSSRIKGGKWSHYLKIGIGVLMLLVSFWYFYNFLNAYGMKLENKPGQISWVKDLDQGLAIAKKENKPIFIDFYADWCIPCVELDLKTFPEKEVIKKAQEFVMIKVDCSTDTPHCEKATKRFDVFGFPTLLFLDSDANRIPEIKIIGGFIDKDKMLELMQKAVDFVRPSS